jgi:hypothetical protein
MPHSRLRRAGGAAVLCAVLAASLASAPASAVEPLRGTPIPDEVVGDRLPVDVISTKTFDLDGDGARELLTVGPAVDAPGVAAVQVWWVDADGHVTASNEVHVRRRASVDEQLTQRGSLGIDRDGMVPVKIAEGAPLFAAQRDGRAVAFVAGEGFPDDGTTPCCLTIWEITLQPDHAIGLTVAADTSRLGSDITVADLDGDGTDELWVGEGPWTYDEGENPPVEVGLLRWNGSRFVHRNIDLGLSAATCCSTPAAVGETDGVAGDDLIVAQYPPDGNGPPHIVRVTLRAGDRFVTETASAGDLGAIQIMALQHGPAIATSDGLSVLHLWSWPRDEAIEPGANRISGAWPVATFGTGSDARIFVSSGGYPTTSIVALPGDLGGGAGPRVEFTRDGRTSAFATGFYINVPPWEGVIPDGLPGHPDAYLFSGQVVFPLPNPAGLAASETGPVMVGKRPVGRVGPDGSWEVVVLNDDQGHYDPGPMGSTFYMFNTSTPGPAQLVAADALLHGESNDGLLEPTFLGAARDPLIEGGLLVGKEAVSAVIHGPPGTIVHWLTRGVPDGEGEIDANGILTIPLLEAAEPDAPNGTRVTVLATAVTPAGHAYAGRWRIRAFRTPPDLDVAVPEGLLQLSPTVSGQTEPGVTLTVNGVPAPVDASGAFTAPVAAGILPTEFRIVATDPVDNVTTRVVSLVWPLDYRRLPFVPIAVVITVIAGLALYLRRPEDKPGRRVADEDATFEEIGG